MKKSAWILAAVFVFFLLIGVYANAQQGLYLSDDFWRRSKEGDYVSSSGCRLLYDADSGLFMFEAGGQEAIVRVSGTEDDALRFDFPDGTAILERDDGFPVISVEVGGVILAFDEEIILTDIQAGSYRYAPEVREEVQYFYQSDEETPVGEMRMLMTPDGILIDSAEYFYVSGEQPPEKAQITLEDGMTLSYNDVQDTLYLNQKGEYLINARDLFGFRIPNGNVQISKRILAGFMMKAAKGEAERRGEPAMVIVYALFYLLGAASWLWPEKMAFLGSRWQYRNDPELSDAGLFSMRIGAVITMGAGVVMMLLPLG